MRVLIINTVMLNGGDAAIADAEISLIRSAFGPDTEIVFQDDHPSITRRHYSDRKVIGSCFWSLIYPSEMPRRGLAKRWKLSCFWTGVWLATRRLGGFSRLFLTPAEQRAVEHYLSSDLVVATGGTYLVEQYDLEQRFFDMSLAIACRRPLALLPQSLGPFQKTDNVKAIASICRAASGIVVRDARSQEHLLQAGVSPESIAVRPDVAFALADPTQLRNAREGSHEPIACRQIAISVRQWNHFKECDDKSGMQRYLAAMASLTEHLVRQHGATVTYLSSCQGVEGYRDDSEIALKIFEQLAASVKPNVIVDRDFHRPTELQSRLQSFDFVVATRMHVGILALGVGTPVFPIAYEFKTEEVFRALGYDEITDIDSVSCAGLVNSVEQFREAFPKLRERVFDSVEQHRRRTCDLISLLRGLIDSGDVEGTGNIEETTADSSLSTGTASRTDRHERSTPPLSVKSTVRRTYEVASAIASSEPGDRPVPSPHRGER